jgi:hypothetical protein
MIWSARSNRYESMHFLLRRLRWLFEGPNSQKHRKFVAALNEDWISNQRIQLERLGHFIQRCPQIRRSFTVANAKAVVCDVKLRAKNRARRSVQLYDESVPVKYDRWQAYPIKRVCDECAGSTPARSDGYFDHTAAERSKKAFFFNAQPTHPEIHIVHRQFNFLTRAKRWC